MENKNKRRATNNRLVKIFLVRPMHLGWVEQHSILINQKNCLYR